MGKAGKERKRLRTFKEVNGSSEVTSEDEGIKKSKYVDEHALVLDVLFALRQNMEFYLDKSCKALRVVLYRLVQIQQDKYFEIEEVDANSKCILAPILCDDNISTTVRYISQLATNIEDFMSPENKSIRKAIHPFVLLQIFSSRKCNAALQGTRLVQAFNQSISDNSLTSRISYQFRKGQWDKALSLLREMYDSKDEVPKLGSVQRWVRDCDIDTFDNTNKNIDADANTVLNMDNSNGVDTSLSSNLGHTAESMSVMRTVYTNPISRQLLHAVMKLMTLHKSPALQANSSSSSDQTPQAENTASLPVSCTFNSTFEVKYADTSLASSWMIYTPDDARDYLIKHGCTSSHVPVLQHTSSIEDNSDQGVPVAPLDNVASDGFASRISIVSHVPGPQRRPPVAHDLNIYMTSPNSIYFHPLQSSGNAPRERIDVPNIPGAFVITNVLTAEECCQFILAAESMKYTPDTVDGIDNVVWLADASIHDAVYNRVQACLPPVIGKCALAGINARFRLFRYYPGAVYRPHIDGAWPGSGLLPDGTFSDDIFNNTLHSRLTFLVYLNDGFEGGETVFYVPNAQEDNSILAQPVQPRIGSVLCFPHGSAVGSLVHEGSAVLKGVKYVIRSDVLYTNV